MQKIQEENHLFVLLEIDIWKNEEIVLKVQAKEENAKKKKLSINLKNLDKI